MTPVRRVWPTRRCLCHKDRRRKNFLHLQDRHSPPPGRGKAGTFVSGSSGRNRNPKETAPEPRKISPARPFTSRSCPHRYATAGPIRRLSHSPNNSGPGAGFQRAGCTMAGPAAGGDQCSSVRDYRRRAKPAIFAASQQITLLRIPVIEPRQTQSHGKTATQDKEGQSRSPPGERQSAQGKTKENQDLSGGCLRW